MSLRPHNRLKLPCRKSFEIKRYDREFLRTHAWVAMNFLDHLSGVSFGFVDNESEDDCFAGLEFAQFGERDAEWSS